MYSVVSVWNVEKGREEEQQRGLEQKVVPLVQQAPGFVTGYWTSDPAAGKAYAMIMLDSEETARQFMAMVEGDPNRRGEVGISPELLAVAKVIAHANSATHLMEDVYQGGDQMGQDARLVVERAYETWNGGDLDGLRQLYAVDAEVVTPGARVQGQEQIGALWGAFLSAFPEGRLTELLTLECGEYVVSENNLSGTHTAPLVTPQGEIPATGRDVSIDGVSVFKIENGEIKSEHLYFDQVTFLTQLGLMPAQSST